MDAPPSPDHVFDFLADEPEPKPVETPINMNSWIEWDVPVGNPGDDEEEESDMDMDDDDEGEEEEEDWEEDDDWLMDPVTSPRATVVENLEHPHGTLTRKMGEVSDAQVKDIISIGEIRPKDRADTHPCEQVLRLSQRVQTLETTLQEVGSENQQLQTRLAESESHEGTMTSYILWMDERLTVLERRL
ncbi:hypothetical protein Tco_0069683 [Tanacetum coccineum]